MTALTRSPELLVAVVNGCDVRSNPLFLPGKLLVPPELAPGTELVVWGGVTYGVLPYTRCNGYLGVLLLVLGCPVPWMTANAFFAWFPSDAAKALGWRKVGLVEAHARACAGFPVVAVAVELPHGHVGMGMPSPDSDPSTFYVTAAGSASTPRQRYSDQFGQLAPRGAFFTHD